MEDLIAFLTARLDACNQDVNKIRNFFENHIPRNDEEIKYAMFALHKLNALEDKDGYLLIAGCLNWLELYATGDMLEDVKKMRVQLPARPGLRDYRSDADNLILTLEHKRKGICLCKSKAEGKNSSPHDELFVSDDRVEVEQGYLIEHHIHCKKCNTKFIVTEDTGYHYPIYNWR
jgi:hypothetical protein